MFEQNASKEYKEKEILKPQGEGRGSIQRQVAFDKDSGFAKIQREQEGEVIVGGCTSFSNLIKTVKQYVLQSDLEDSISKTPLVGDKYGR